MDSLTPNIIDTDQHTTMDNKVSMDPELENYIEMLKQQEVIKAAFKSTLEDTVKPSPLPVKTDITKKYTPEQLEKIKKCPLHHRMLQGCGLWYSPNNFGYSTWSPGCNACAMGHRDRERGLWMSGWGVPDNE